MRPSITRRTALQQLATGSALMATAPLLTSPLAAAPAARPAELKGRIRHSVCRWCYNDIPLDTLCREAAAMGLTSVELVGVNEFPVLAQHGLTCAMVHGAPGGIVQGFNRLENHDRLVAFYEEAIPLTARAGHPNIICFSGNRDGQSDEQGLAHCVTGLKRVAPIAEKHGVTVCMELLNSRVNHPDYMCDRTPWGVEMCRQVGSERVKLLYDIYHMQIMEGDVIRTIQDNHAYFAHYHTGGVPGRAEIDETQELFYPAIMRAILATGYRGFVGQEFVPKRPDKLASLRQGVQICDA
jgi:hydroxypyruvate isomerase